VQIPCLKGEKLKKYILQGGKLKEIFYRGKAKYAYFAEVNTY
jgi:hypothetical protein